MLGGAVEGVWWSWGGVIGVWLCDGRGKRGWEDDGGDDGGGGGGGFLDGSSGCIH